MSRCYSNVIYLFLIQRLIKESDAHFKESLIRKSVALYSGVARRRKVGGRGGGGWGTNFFQKSEKQKKKKKKGTAGV